MAWDYTLTVLVTSRNALDAAPHFPTDLSKRAQDLSMLGWDCSYKSWMKTGILIEDVHNLRIEIC